MHFSLRSVILFAALWGLATPLWAPQKAPPPSIALAGNDTVLVVAKAVAAEGDRIRFRIGRHLRGEVKVEAKTLDLRLDPSTRAHVRPGRRYLVGLTKWVVTRRPGAAKGLEESPDGWRLQRATVLGEAIFPHRRSVRRLLLRPGPEAPRGSRLINDLLAVDDPLGQRLFAAELAVNQLLGELPERHQERLVLAMKSSRFDDQAIDLVLNAIPREAGGVGWADIVRHVLATRPLALDSMSPTPALVLTALERVRHAPPEPRDLELGARWLEASNQGLLEAAFELLRSRDPDRTLREARIRLEAPALTPTVRRWLETRVAELQKKL